MSCAKCSRINTIRVLTRPWRLPRPKPRLPLLIPVFKSYVSPLYHMDVDWHPRMTFLGETHAKTRISASTSHDSHYIAFLKPNPDNPHRRHLHLYRPLTGFHEVSTYAVGTSIWIPPDRQEIWRVDVDQVSPLAFTPGGLKRPSELCGIEHLPPACPGDLFLASMLRITGG